MTKVYLNKRITPRIAMGHPWIYNNEVDRIAGTVSPGDIVEVYYFDGQLAGRGYINPGSQIIIRLLTRKREPIDAGFFHQKISEAWAYRQQLGYTENCRLVFGEADGLPALIIDKFNDYFVLQTLSLGIEQWKTAIVDAINTIFKPKGIYERNDVPVRELEGLEQKKDFLSDPFPTEIIIRENGLQFYVDIEHGQKTGYFLDNDYFVELDKLIDQLNNDVIQHERDELKEQNNVWFIIFLGSEWDEEQGKEYYIELCYLVVTEELLFDFIKSSIEILQCST